MSTTTARQRLVVVGASLAGLRAVEAARSAGHTGPITLIGAEPHLPYDRPPLSKKFLTDGPCLPAPTYKTYGELAAHDVDLILDQPATRLNIANRRIHTATSHFDYDAAIIATGSTPRRLPGAQLNGVHALRSIDDARGIRMALDHGARTVVVGAGFIGLEVATAVLARGLPVTIIEAADRPLSRSVGEEASELLTSLVHASGACLRCGIGVDHLEATGGHVSAVILADGTRLPADLVVVGIGATPATEWLTDSGLKLDDGALCDPTMATSAPGVWAAGDVARIIDADGVSTRVEHWTAAAEEAALAGANAVAVLRGDTPRQAPSVPYFWSDLHGAKIQMVGTATGADACEVLGDADGPWLILYRRHDRLIGALSRDLPGRIMKFRALLARGASYEQARDLAHSRPLPVAAHQG